MKNILITGSAGFIGYHLAQKLLVKKYKVYGIDNFSNSYELKIKKLRIKNLIKNKKNFSNLRKKIPKKISYRNREKYIDNLSIKKIEELYDYLLNLEKPIKKK